MVVVIGTHAFPCLCPASVRTHITHARSPPAPSILPAHISHPRTQREGSLLFKTLYFPLHSFLPSSAPLILLFLILRHPSYSFLEWRERGATVRLGRRFGSGGAATTPGTALGPAGCHPRGRPVLSRAPARTPQRPNTPPTGPGDAGVSGIPEGTVGGDRECGESLVDRGFSPAAGVSGQARYRWRVARGS